jgi:hypothetical protein
LDHPFDASDTGYWNCAQNALQFAGQFHVPPVKSEQATSGRSLRHAVVAVLQTCLLANLAAVQS